ncbi:MAG: hydrogenase maturation protease [Veillonella sp.]
MTNTSTDIISGLKQYADSEGPRIDLNSLYDDGNNEIVLLGVGNILLTDEVRCSCSKRIEESFTFTPAISIIDGGTMGMELLTYMRGMKKILLVDAINGGMSRYI